MTGGSIRLGRPELAPLVDELARRLSEGVAVTTVALRGLPEPVRRAVADLLGSDRVPSAANRVRIDRLLAALGMASVDDLRAAVEELRGPLADRRAERQREQADRDALWSWLAVEASAVGLTADRSRLDQWVASQRINGAWGGVEMHRRRLERALAVLRSLPADGVPLSALAADLAGGPHALDHGTRLAAIVLDAIRLAFDTPRPSGAEDIRILWETVGVAPDPHSSTVLVLGLPGGSWTPLGRWLDEAAAAGEPVVLSLSNLRRWPVRPLAPGTRVFVVENPAIVAEAAAGGWTGPVVVCSSGRPTVAVLMLLRQLGADGATVLQHADFDPDGLAITAWLAERAGTIPWQMSLPEYLAAVDRFKDRPRIRRPVPDTPWDPGLRSGLEHHLLPVYEEDLRTDLLTSMRRTSS